MKKTEKFHPGQRVVAAGRSGTIIARKFDIYLVEIDDEVKHHRLMASELSLQVLDPALILPFREPFPGSFAPGPGRVDSYAEGGRRVLIDGTDGGVIIRGGRTRVWVLMDTGHRQSFFVPNDRVIYS
ncbi:MAG: hypothetical protein M3Q07_22435 [Pseudobdellovibrionaceae bacterium]|nr:hypothetical protein [Pseudobdellovibrionaceae bacterium]